MSLLPGPTTELGRYRILSSTAGIRVSPLVLGGGNIGTALTAYMAGGLNKEESFAYLDSFVEAGGNWVDTSNAYQAEQSESWIGEWMAARGNRDRIVVATKFTNDYRAHDPAVGKGYPNYSGNSRKSLHISVAESLRKLQTTYIDILYVHWWDYTTSIKELMDSLHVLVQQGKVLYLGASNFPAWVVAAANTYALEQGKTPFSVYTGRWNILLRDMEREVLPMARQFGMAIVPWGAVGMGKWKTKKEVEERLASGSMLRSIYGSPEQTEDDMKMSEALGKVAAEHGTDSLTAIALAYLMSKYPRVYPLIGGRRVEQLHENIKSLSITLTEEQTLFLESVKPFDLGWPGNFIGQDPFLKLVGTQPVTATTLGRFSHLKLDKP